MDQVTRLTALKAGCKLAGDIGGVFSHLARHVSAPSGGEVAHGELAHRVVGRVVKEDHVLGDGWVPLIHLELLLASRCVASVDIETLDAQASAAVNKRSAVRTDRLNVFVASDSPKRSDAFTVVPVTRGLLSETIPCLPRIAELFVNRDCVNIELIQRAQPRRRGCGHQPSQSVCHCSRPQRHRRTSP